MAPLYVVVGSPAATWIARRECAEAIGRGEADSLFAGEPGGSVQAGAGRGPMDRFSLGGRPVIGKRALHGGLFGSLLGRWYLGSRRAVDQLRAAIRLERSGVA